ncbi:Ppx/GppA phosphatase family protein [Sulfurimonas sp. C5]|uniref:Ppx/GppA phosphatase family protein n=1 Tax=Sulfurimonas sp. C5 TaxID=3036947 RepID=UPI002458F6F6|nr:Ppx/GppA phosphatase family protein [Sulfurimonas sp. C5]MDH4945365.1 Ppx/GppA phosphatase family protein [Sulfurimonas sp. C5]
MAKRVSIIDIGSNSVRMVIYEKTSRFAFHLLHEEKSKVRISEHAYKHDGILQEIPMQRTFDALENFLKISESFKAKKVLCVATSALRDAPNKKDFVQKVREKLKLNIKIISGEKEAYYGAIACANLLPKQHNAMSIDIGGGSTEIAFIDANNVSYTLSLDLGTVRLKELFFDTDDLDGAKEYIRKELDKIPMKDLTTLIGIGGTFRAISSAIQKSQCYPLNKLHAFEYTQNTFKTYIKRILEADEKELSNLYIKENRFDVIKPGALILEIVIEKFAIENCITSGVGVREGVFLADLLRSSKHQFPANYNTSVKYILDAHLSDKQFSNNLTKLTKQIFDLTYEFFNLDYSYREKLSIAAKLYPSGSNIHFYSQNKHSYYIAQTALEYGFTHQDITLIATLMKFAKNKLPARSHIEKYQMLLPEEQILNPLSFLLSLSIILLSHRPRNIDFELSFKNGILKVSSQSNLYLAKDGVAKVQCFKDFQVVFNA